MNQAARGGRPSDLAGLGEVLGSLDEREVTEHPQALDDVYRAIVDDLDALGRAGAAPDAH